MDYITIITTLLGILFGLGFGWLKYVFSSGKLMREAGEFMTAVGRAIEDKDVSNDDLTSILKEFNDVKVAWNEIKNLKK